MLLSRALAVLITYAAVVAADCRTQSYPGTVYKNGTAAECTGRANAVCQAGQTQQRLNYSYDGDLYYPGNGCAVAVTCCTK
ncbi:hypothetical protein CKAH01_15251 [Colletotrichum kahawae]|uniref:Uncharacterized protein n=1 Tax=Colletotrichum kahawae TaxID=34407 RepID=A0AAD9YJR0_COLKA|nr:hypothetical protein CKAH01_15251 [Colletotrichum kahawae]